MKNKKIWIIILAVAIGAYWIGYNHNQQLSNNQLVSTTKPSPIATIDPLKAFNDFFQKQSQPQLKTPAMTQKCYSVFNTLVSTTQPLGQGISFSDFGNLVTSYMKECSPNINTTRGFYGAGIDIDLGRVPLQGYGKTEGATDYTLNCNYYPNDDLIHCQTLTKTPAWDQHNNYGTLNCGVNYIVCDFNSDEGNKKGDWPQFGKPQRFVSTVDRKHGFNCT